MIVGPGAGAAVAVLRCTLMDLLSLSVTGPLLTVTLGCAHPASVIPVQISAEPFSVLARSMHRYLPARAARPDHHHLSLSRSVAEVRSVAKV